MIYLERADFIRINKGTIEAHGGTFTGTENIKDLNLFESMVESAKNDLYYPSLFEKAAVLMLNITVFHLFSDGCKRTGFLAAAAFLELNDYELTASNQEVIDSCLRLADAKQEGLTRQDVVTWLIANSREIDLEA